MIKWNTDAEKLTDQAFSRLLIISLFWIFLAMVALCSVTWAWFGHSMSSGPIKLEAGTYNAEIAVYATSQAVGEAGNVAEVLTEISPYEIDGTIYRYAFEKEVLYRVRIDFSDSTSSGYCKIYVNGLDTVYANMERDDGIFEFAIEVSADTTVSIETRWGTYSGESAFAYGGTVALTVPWTPDAPTNVSGADGSEKETTAEETTAEETTAEETTEEETTAEETTAEETTAEETTAEETTAEETTAEETTVEPSEEEATTEEVSTDESVEA